MGKSEYASEELRAQARRLKREESHRRLDEKLPKVVWEAGYMIEVWPSQTRLAVYGRTEGTLGENEVLATMVL